MYEQKRHLGFAPGVAIAATGSTGVGLPLAAAIAAGTGILQMLHIRPGAREADAIVPVQNAIANDRGTGRLDEINRAIDSANVQGLQSMYAEVVQMARDFRAFVGDPKFTDGRASIQALDTLMPLIDGTDSTGEACAVNVWGNPCNGGTLGTIARRLAALGAAVLLRPPELTAGYGTTISQLRYPTQDFPFITQAGTLPPVAPLSPIRSPGIQQVGGMADMWPLLAVAAGAVFLLRK